MNPSPLETLHQQFSEALKNHAYMGVSKVGAPLEETDTKEIRLHEVFKIARQQIEDDLKAAKPLDEANELSHLKLLKTDGEDYYERYQTSTNTWARSLLKALASHTPAFLKKYLPACFSNEIVAAEQKTKEEYQAYKHLIQKHIQILSKNLKVDTLKVAEAEEDALGDDYIPKTEDELDDDLLNEIYDEDNEGLDGSLEDIGEDDGRDPKKKELANRFLKGLKKREVKIQDEKKTKEPKVEEDKSAKGKDDKVEKPKKAEPKDFFDIEVLDDEILEGEKGSESKPAAKDSASASAAKKAAAPEPVLLPDALVPTGEEVEAIKNHKLEAAYQRIKGCLNAFKQFDQFPLSSEKYKNLLGQLSWATIQVLKLDPDNGKAVLAASGIADADLKALSDPELSVALTIVESQKLKDLLKPTQWNGSFGKAEAQKGYMTFGIQKIAGQTAIMLLNDSGAKVKEGDFKAYQGRVRIFLGGVNLFTSMIELDKFLEANKATCRPCKIEIIVSDKQTLTPDFVKLLLSLRGRCAEIQILGLKELNFKEGEISAEDEHQLVQLLDTFNFIGDIKNIVLSGHPKKDWSAGNFSALLALCPTMELLQECCTLCSSPKDIVLPNPLLTLEKGDFSGFDPDLIPHLLGQFTELNEVDLSCCAVTDEQLGVWIASGLFDNVTTLNFNNCEGLTTDVLHYLMKLENLTTLSLPDLPKGNKYSLDALPSFDNPFKINLFYTASKATQQIAAERYTGPLTWAAAFQIPLARNNREAPIFIPGMNRLDPKSVAFWLYYSDYELLEPQEQVTTVLADSNAELTDGNIVEFMQKFPNTRALSLYNCPLVTTDGIVRLLKACPQLRTLDLTGCPHITEDLFFGDGNLELLKKLNSLIITDTGILPGVASAMQENELAGKLEFKETTLTITDDDLTDDQALENLLEGRTLNTLKRINLEGCKKLTNQMLGQLLDRLNADIFIKNEEGATVDNPQRLNLAVLNLSDCSEITEEAFDDVQSDEGKVNTKRLENLDRMIIGGTKIKEVLKGVYPKVTFQEVEEPVTITIDPAAQLQMCQLFCTTQDEKAKKELAATFVSDRIVVELFGSECDDKAVQMVRSWPVNTADEQFCDLTLTFKTDNEAAPSVFPAHRDVLYSRSLYFVNGLRPGGLLSKIPGMDYVNVHATPAASQAIMDYFYGRLKVEDLDWKTAADAAELAGLHIFNLSKDIKKLLMDRFRSQFDKSDLKKAEEMLVAAHALEDNEGIKQFEVSLIAALKLLGKITKENRIKFQPFANLANSKHGLTELKKETDKIEEDLTRALEKQIIDAQNKTNEKLVKAMIKSGELADMV